MCVPNTDLRELPKRNLTAVSQKEKEDLDDISNELELADEDDKIPYGPTPENEFTRSSS